MHQSFLSGKAYIFNNQFMVIIPNSTAAEENIHSPKNIKSSCQSISRCGKKLLGHVKKNNFGSVQIFEFEITFCITNFNTSSSSNSFSNASCKRITSISALNSLLSGFLVCLRQYCYCRYI